jgi:hypothetical protein
VAAKETQLSSNRFLEMLAERRLERAELRRGWRRDIRPYDRLHLRIPLLLVALKIFPFCPEAYDPNLLCCGLREKGQDFEEPGLFLEDW